MSFFSSLLNLDISPRARGFIVDIALYLEAGEKMKAYQVVDQASTLSLKKTMNELKDQLDSGELSVCQINDIKFIFELVLTCIKQK